MTPDPQTVAPDLSVRTAFFEMRAAGFRHSVVIEDGRLAGGHQLALDVVRSQIRLILEHEGGDAAHDRRRLRGAGHHEVVEPVVEDPIDMVSTNDEMRDRSTVAVESSQTGGAVA